jgi:hypothetical protein
LLEGVAFGAGVGREAVFPFVAGLSAFSSVTSSESEAVPGRAPSVRVVHADRRSTLLTIRLERMRLDDIERKNEGRYGLAQRKDRRDSHRAGPHHFMNVLERQVSCTTSG